MKNKVKIQIVLLGLIFVGSLITFTGSYISHRENDVVYFLRDTELISEGDYAGSYLIAQKSGNVSIVTATQETRWTKNMNGSEIRDVDILPNGNILIADYSTDRIIEINPDNPDQILWAWEARNVLHINWSEYAIAKNWSTPVRAFLNQSVDFSIPWAGISEIEFVLGSDYNRNYDSILVTLTLFDMIIEIRHSTTPSILWSYGIPGNHYYLDAPLFANYVSTGNVIVTDTGNHRLIELQQTWHYVIWNCKIFFPEGNMRRINDVVEVNSTHLIVSDSESGKIQFLNKTSKAFEQEISYSSLMNPIDIDMVGQSLLITDIDNVHLVSLFDLESEPIFETKNYLNPFYIVTGLVTIYHVILFSYEFIQFLKEDVRSKFRKSALPSRLTSILLCSLAIAILPDIISFYLNFDSLM